MNKELMSPFKALSHLTYRAAMDNDTTVVQCLEWHKVVSTSLEVLDILKEKMDIGVVILGDQPKIRFTYNGQLHFYDISQEEYETVRKAFDYEL